MLGGWLIAMEGIDGAGKTTQVGLLADALRAIGHEVVVTKEPTSGPSGQKIRELSMAGADITPEEELGYFIADRHEHVRDLIEPALARGAVVITDRYYLSNVAYQGARGLSADEVLARNEALFPAPSAAILLEVTPQEGLRRVVARGGPLNQSYEQAPFLTRVSEIFAGLGCSYLKRVAGEASPEVVHAEVKRALAGLFDFAGD
jgi:dTMP kinase